MKQLLIRRIGGMIPLLIGISVVSFLIIQLPAGDYVTTHVTQLMESSGDVYEGSQVEALRVRYGLDRPLVTQYLLWMKGIALHGDFGYSFEWNRPVNEIIRERLGLTVGIALAALLFAWIIAFPIGVVSAVKPRSLFDYGFTGVGFIGLSIPNFMLALILMYLAFRYLKLNVSGLFSPEYLDAPWSWAKLLDMLQRIWVPIIVVGTAETAALIRIMRNNLLDELRKQYVISARARGLPEPRLLFKYPVRLALNPFISTIGWTLPQLISGQIIIGVVLSLPTTGPVMLRAFQSQDMYLGGSFVFLLAALTLIGTLLSDILLALSDPRIRIST